jgi:hypothetical protein
LSLLLSPGIFIISSWNKICIQLYLAKTTEQKWAFIYSFVNVFC